MSSLPHKHARRSSLSLARVGAGEGKPRGRKSIPLRFPRGAGEGPYRVLIGNYFLYDPHPRPLPVNGRGDRQGP